MQIIISSLGRHRSCEFTENLRVTSRRKLWKPMTSAASQSICADHIKGLHKDLLLIATPGDQKTSKTDRAPRVFRSLCRRPPAAHPPFESTPDAVEEQLNIPHHQATAETGHCRLPRPRPGSDPRAAPARPAVPSLASCTSPVAGIVAALSHAPIRPAARRDSTAAAKCRQS